jgi:hypothetical protein
VPSLAWKLDPELAPTELLAFWAGLAVRHRAVRSGRVRSSRIAAETRSGDDFTTCR